MNSSTLLASAKIEYSSGEILRSDLDVDGVIELSRDLYRATNAEGFNAMYGSRHNDDMQADKSSEEEEDSEEGED